MLAQPGHSRVHPLSAVHRLDSRLTHEEVHILADLHARHEHGLVQPVGVELIGAYLLRGPQTPVDQVISAHALLRVVNACGEVVVAVAGSQIGHTGVRAVRTLAYTVEGVQGLLEVTLSPPGARGPAGVGAADEESVRVDEHEAYVVLAVSLGAADAASAPAVVDRVDVGFPGEQVGGAVE